MDPFALADMMKATGPLKTTRGTVASKDVAGLLLRDSYELPQGQQNKLIASLIEAFWKAIDEGANPPALVAGLSDAVATQHLKLYSTDSTAASSLHELDADGDFRAYGPNVQMIYHNNLGANKVDYYLERFLGTRVELQSDGSARVRVNISWHNRAPSGPPSILLGDETTAARPGHDNMLVDFLLPKHSRVRAFSIDRFDESPIKGADSGFPRFWTTHFLSPGESSKAIMSYTVPRAVDLGGEAPFQFALFPQVSVNPDLYSLDVVAPNGYEFVEGDATTYHSAGTLDRPVTFETRLRRLSGAAAQSSRVKPIESTVGRS
jgi:hypothetical protein